MVKCREKCVVSRVFQEADWEMRSVPGVLIRECCWDQRHGEEGSRIGQREELVCDAVLIEASASPLGSLEAGMALLSC